MSANKMTYKCGQTSGNIGLCKLGVTEGRGGPAVHVVVLVKARMLKPLSASGELLGGDDLVSCLFSTLEN